MPPEEELVVFRRAPRVLGRRQLRDLARRLCRELAGGRPFTCLVTDDRELRRLNREFLGRDYPADVLSFPLSTAGRGQGECGTASPLGDIAVSAQRAGQEAARRGHSVEQEIGILMLHGLLHLLGMDHERDRGAMRRAERLWQARFGLPGSLTGRSAR